MLKKCDDFAPHSDFPPKNAIYLHTIDESRKAWDDTRNNSWADVAEQQRFQGEHNTMVAKNFDDDTEPLMLKRITPERAMSRLFLDPTPSFRLTRLVSYLENLTVLG